MCGAHPKAQLPVILPCNSASAASVSVLGNAATYDVIPSKSTESELKDIAAIEYSYFQFWKIYKELLFPMLINFQLPSIFVLTDSKSEKTMHSIEST